MDADGDGFDSCGPWDCDDADPSTRPGATDPFGDGIDQDCDGTDGVGVVPAVWMVAPGFLDGSGHTAALGQALLRADTDADGCDDLVVSNGGMGGVPPYPLQGSSGTHVVVGCTSEVLTLGQLNVTSAGTALHRWARPDGDRVVSGAPHDASVSGQPGFFEVLSAAGGALVPEGRVWAVDPGDAHPGAVFWRGGSPHYAASHRSSTQMGPVRVFALPVPAGSVQEVPHEEWLPILEGLHLGRDVLAVDRDGDGDQELAVAVDPVAGNAPGTVLVLAGPSTIETSQERWLGPDATGQSFGGNLERALDLMNDGAPWILASGAVPDGTGAMFALPPLGPGEHDVSDSPLLFLGEMAGDFFGTSAAVSDLNGDGVMDVAIGAPGITTNRPGKVMVWYGPFTQPSYSRADADAVFVGEHPGSLFGWDLEVADLDGDGAPELYASAPWYSPEPPTLEGVGRVYRLDLP